MLTIAYVVDLVIGDPRWAPHPVRIMGSAIEETERNLRRWFEDYADAGQKFAGLIIALFIPALAYLTFYLVSAVLEWIGLRLIVTIVLIYLIASSFATRELVRSAMAVIDALRVNNIKDAREKLSMIVGRDTHSLDRKGILIAVVETLAENASDGIVAPMFYFVMGGLPLAMAYKAVNTLDSMVGYKNEKYRHFGWASARLDDIANFIPARITGALIVLSSMIYSVYPFPCSATSRDAGWKNAWRIMRRDGRKHSSPNSGIPEAAMAGALGVRLGGPSSYGGRMCEKPYIGEDTVARSGELSTVDKTRFADPRRRIRNEESASRTLPCAETDTIYFGAVQDAIVLTKIASILGLVLMMILLYLRKTI